MVTITANYTVFECAFCQVNATVHLTFNHGRLQASSVTVAEYGLILTDMTFNAALRGLRH